MIKTEHQLDELLSTPTQADIEAMRQLEGDLIILGVGGKMGPTLALRARRAVESAGVRKRVIGVSRFSTHTARELLEKGGIETISADLLERSEVESLPDAANVMFMAGRKFGSTGAESLTWAMNGYVPALVCERFRGSRIVAFSSGNVYSLVPVTSGGATESTSLQPVGEYAQSVLARERIFEHFSTTYNIPTVLLRLNYAVDLRYGVLLDIGSKVFARQAVDVTMGVANVIWQGDANSVALRSFAVAQSPALVLNLTGPETLSVRYIASRFGEHFGIEPQFTGSEASTAILNNAARCHRIFGYPTFTVEEIIDWTASWISMGGTTLNKPTHFETRDGQY